VNVVEARPVMALMLRAPLLSAALLLSTPGFAGPAAPDDLPEDLLEGAKEHPAIRNYPGCWVTQQKEREFEELDFPVGVRNDETVTRKVSGALFAQKVYFPQKVTCTQVLGNYEAAFQKAGMVVRRGESNVDQPLLSDGCKWVSAEGKEKGSDRPLFAVQNCCHSPEYAYGALTVVTAQAMQQKVEVDADGIEQELESAGRISLYGINFATGKADITPDSAKALSDIATVMKGRPGWKLRVEGHTDDVGQAAANLELSKRRAAAVKDWLVKKHGIDAGRLTTEGLGQTKLLAPNDSDAARARNRRVELVKL